MGLSEKKRSSTSSSDPHSQEITMFNFLCLDLLFIATFLTKAICHCFSSFLTTVMKDKDLDLVLFPISLMVPKFSGTLLLLLCRLIYYFYNFNMYN